MQAAGDGEQGWENALLYVFLSPTMRSMLFRDPHVALMAKRPNQNGPEQMAQSILAQRKMAC